MITIDQDALCEFCEKQEIARLDNCEGSRCDEARDAYMDEHGLIENEERKNTFKDLILDDVVYALDGKELTFKEMLITGIDRDSDRMLTFLGINGYLFRAKATETMCHADSSETYFLKKKDLKTHYETLMLKKIKRMAEALSKMS